ncbi:endonuclease/exonuclease/phosphatase family metal-dependent hydrolase [Paenibacillus sp. DS2015]|uniref:endonuclease/exonuclease/phosphatase family protein n=1 Tax=Paenibacillus sp. DS2015 TaxID=3373917 RepID=UPI003D1A9932
MKKRLLKMLGSVVLVATLIVGGFLLYITLTDYNPGIIEELSVDNNNERMLKLNEPFTITTFNIGYAGLDKDQDFFMDGGTMSRSNSEEQTKINLAAIASFMTTLRSDLFMMQEVDVRSSRSYHVDEVTYLSSELSEYSHVFATNYKVPWVPVPILDPMGSVDSGLLTLSRFKSTDNSRYNLPGKESWPRQQLDLDRAFVESRFPVDNGKELVLVNLHLSAFDQGGTIRKQQLDYLSSFMKREHDQGNYLILGGDWNHVLPGTDPQTFKTTQTWPEWLQQFPEGFTPEGFSWVIDPNVPSVRTLDIPYSEGVNFRAVIDGFLISPNIKLNIIQGHDLSFKHSDHNPVTAELVLQ